MPVSVPAHTRFCSSTRMHHTRSSGSPWRVVHDWKLSPSNRTTPPPYVAIQTAPAPSSARLMTCRPGISAPDAQVVQESSRNRLTPPSVATQTAPSLARRIENTELWRIPSPARQTRIRRRSRSTRAMPSLVPTHRLLPSAARQITRSPGSPSAVVRRGPQRPSHHEATPAPSVAIQIHPSGVSAKFSTSGVGRPDSAVNNRNAPRTA